MKDNKTTAVYVFARRMLISLSVDKIVQQRYVNLSINFWDLPTKVKMIPFLFKKREFLFICVHVEGSAARGLIQIMQLRIGFSWCIGQKRLIICGVCICQSFSPDILCFLPFWCKTIFF